MKNFNCVLLLSLLISLCFIIIPLSKNVLSQIIVSLLFFIIAYFFIIALKRDRKSKYKTTDKKRYIPAVLCVTVFAFSSVVFQILIYLKNTVKYNYCVYMSLLHFIISMILAFAVLSISKNNVNNTSNTSAFVKIILLINLIVNFIISCLLIFGYYINDSGVIIIS